MSFLTHVLFFRLPIPIVPFEGAGNCATRPWTWRVCPGWTPSGNCLRSQLISTERYPKRSWVLAKEVLLMATRNPARKPPGICIKPVVINGIYDIYHINWCRISSINSVTIATTVTTVIASHHQRIWDHPGTWMER